MSKVYNVKVDKDGGFTWRIRGQEAIYYTNRNGEGIFVQDDNTGESRQLVGTCQFSSCDTVSGMRRKLKAIFDEEA